MDKIDSNHLNTMFRELHRLEHLLWDRLLRPDMLGQVPAAARRRGVHLLDDDAWREWMRTSVANVEAYATKTRDSEKRQKAMAEAGACRSALLGIQRLRNKIVELNYGLVSVMVDEFRVRQEDKEDLFQQGVLGLIRSTEKFDPDRGFKFSTYASHWIHHLIERYCDDRQLPVRLPVHMQCRFSKMISIDREFTQKLGRRPTDDEVVQVMIGREKADKKATALQIDRAHMARSANSTSLHLDATLVGSDGMDGCTLHDLLPDPRSESPVRRVEALHDLQRAVEVVDRNNLGDSKIALKPSELLFSRLAEDHQTLQDLGTKYGLSRERVRQVQVMAMRFAFELRQEYRRASRSHGRT
jgi:RNA polymerase sigma factor (sigma-70 family)